MKVNPDAPAFPESYIGNERPHEGIGDGLSVRAYFAAKAMQGMQANPEMLGASATDLAEFSVAAADALIAELNKENSND